MSLRPVLITEQPTTVRDYIKQLICQKYFFFSFYFNDGISISISNEQNGSRVRVSNGYAMYVAVHIRLTVSSISPVAFSRKLLQLIRPRDTTS